MNMRMILAILIGVGLLSGLFFVLKNFNNAPVSSQNVENNSVLISENDKNSTQSPSVVAEGLDTPWAIDFLPNGDMLITERKGTVRIVKNGKLESEPVATIENAKEFGEGGLMGMAIHPDFSSNQYVYFYYTYSGSGNDTLNRVVRMTLKENKLSNEEIIVDKIPGAIFHNGGRIKFGPDKNLYIGTGDANQPSQSQNRESLAGKILRVTDEGKPVSGNPFNSPIFAYGNRNVQGFAWNKKDEFWSTEHGPSGGNLGTGNDEINKIEAGKNYGWPEIQGNQTRDGMTAPVKNSGVGVAWAPAGAVFVEDSLFFGGLRGEALYEAVIKDNQVVELKEHFKGEYGRIRDVVLGPDEMLYVATSNQDGRGRPKSGDDKIIRVNVKKLMETD